MDIYHLGVNKENREVSSLHIIIHKNIRSLRTKTQREN